MDHGYWTPPNRGKTNTVTSLSYGMGCGTPTSSAQPVPATNGTSVARGNGKSADPTIRDNAIRGARLTNTSERYGPVGVVQVKRAYHGPGCPDCATRPGVRAMPSALGAQDVYRSARKG